MIQHDGCLISELAGNEADWMVLVHGVSQDHRIFDRQVEAYEKTYRLLLINLPGHGVSSNIPGPYGLPEFASHIQGCAATHGLEGAIFWGTHLGASAGLLAACDSPAQFSTLVLESPVFPGRALPSVSDLLAKLPVTAAKSGMDQARQQWWEEGPWFDLMRSEPQRCRAEEHWRIISDFEGGPWLETDLISKPIGQVDEKLAALSAPTILVNGQHDVADFLDAADALQELIPNTMRVEVPGAGGFPLWEQPATVNKMVRKALQDVASIR